MGLFCLGNKQRRKREGKVNGCRLQNLKQKNNSLHQVQQYSQIMRICVQDGIHMHAYHHYEYNNYSLDKNDHK